MRTLLSRPIQVDPSFHIGLGLIVVVALAEIFAATSYYVGRARAGRISMQPTAEAAARRSVPLVSSLTPPPAGRPAFSPAAAPAASPSLVEQLLREGMELRDRGDMTNAIDRMQEALDSEPDNSTVLVEIAKTYDLMQRYDRANEIWRKIQELGPSAGPAYAWADRRLKLGVPSPAAAGPSEAQAGVDSAMRKDVGGTSQGPIMGITEVKTTETPDPEAETNLALEIGIKKQPGATVDHTKVKILVEFYDTVGDKDIKLTDADVNYEWLTPKHDWSDTNPEVLLVRYVRPKTSGGSSESSLGDAATTALPGQKGRRTKGSVANGGERKYLGYIVRVYYDDDLQAEQAEPSRLLQQFPASKGRAAP
jgi:tetratricopeptide (TPR) repeat protein